MVAIYRNIRLAWRLFWDPRVPLLLKFLIPLAGAYLLFPLDLVRDFIPFFGWIDDLIALIIGLIIFVKLAPRPIVEEHRQNIWGARMKEKGDVTDAEYKVFEDKERE